MAKMLARSLRKIRFQTLLPTTSRRWFTGTVDPQSAQGCSAVKVNAIKAAIQQKIVSPDKPLGLFYNLTTYRGETSKLKAAFPANFAHTMAVKANPMRKLMEISRDCGLGFESASLGELQQSLNVTTPDNIVFDSPAKTRSEIDFSLSKGVFLNLDNLQELKHVDDLVKEKGKNYPPLKVGLRINPQVGFGSIKEFSTAGVISKFGISMEHKAQVIDAYVARPWLNGIHVHVGSQGYTCVCVCVYMR